MAGGRIGRRTAALACAAFACVAVPAGASVISHPIHGPFPIGQAQFDIAPPATTPPAGPPDDGPGAGFPGRGGGSGRPHLPVSSNPLSPTSLFRQDPAVDGRALDSGIAASESHLVLGTIFTLAFHNKDGSLVTGRYGQFARRVVQRRFPNPIGVGSFFAPVIADAQQNLKLDPKVAAQGSTFQLDLINDARVTFDTHRKRFFITATAINYQTKVDPPASGDPVPAIYDGSNDRLERGSRRTIILLAVSKSQDPRDGFHGYWYDAVPDQGACSNTNGDTCPGTEFKPGDAADYPHIAVDRNFFMESHHIARRKIDSATFPDDVEGRPTVAFSLRADQLANGCKPNGCEGFRHPYVFTDDNKGNPVRLSGVVRLLPVEQYDQKKTDESIYMLMREVDGSFRMEFWLVSPNGDFHVGERRTIGIPAWQSRSGRVAERGLAGAADPTWASPPTVGVPGPGLQRAVVRQGQLFTSMSDCLGDSPDSCDYGVRLLEFDVSNPRMPQWDRDKAFRVRSGNTVVHAGLPTVDVTSQRNLAFSYWVVGPSSYVQARVSAWPNGVASPRSSARLGTADGPCIHGGDGKCNEYNHGTARDPFDPRGVWVAGPVGYRACDLSTNPCDKRQNVTIAAGRLFGQAHPNLVVEVPSLRVRGTRLGHVVVTGSVQNLGDGVARRIRVRVSSGGRTLTVPVANVPASGRRSFTATLAGRSRPGAGRDVTVRVDPDRRVREYSERDNSFTLPR